jgi:hypothetical protein
MKKSDVQAIVIVVLKAQSRNFAEFMKLIFIWIPKHQFILDSYSISTQIYKKNLCQ